MQGARRMRRPRIARLAPLALVVLLPLLVGACARARAEVVPEGPPLQVPAPPERVLAPVEEPAVAEAPPEPAAPPTAAAPRTPPRPAATESRPAAPAAAQQTPPPAPPAETRELRTSLPASAPTERAVRDTLARATRDIGRVNYSRLSADGRAQYEQAKRFGEQAEDALRERNLIFAATLADKAATLAAELAGR